MNLNRNRYMAFPSQCDFEEASQPELVSQYSAELKKRMERDNMSAEELEYEIRFMQRAKQAKNIPFATHEEFVDFASKWQAYTSCLSARRLAFA